MSRGRATMLVLALFAPAAGAQSSPTEDEAALEEELRSVLEEETEIATRTRQNADYVPGIVSVLHGDEMLAIGARTVLDALSTVPGVEINRDQGGAATLRVRGLDFFFNSGNVKVLVNGLDTSFQVSGQNSVTLLMPLQQVERIEVIRGPGSSVYGDFAFTGLVNVITRQDRNHAWLSGGNGARYAAGASLQHQGEWTLAGNLAAYRGDRYDEPDGTAADERRVYGELQIARGGFSFKAHALDRDHDRLVVPAPPPDQPARFEREEQVWALETRYDWTLASETRIGVWGTFSTADYRAPPPAFEGLRYALGGDASWRWGSHRLLAQASWGALTIERAVPGQPPRPPGAPPSPRPERVSDHLPSWSVLVQDEVAIGERLTLTAGLRYDAFDDIDTRATPRLAAVWRLDDRHALKAQYAEGFRTPLVVELYDTGLVNRDIDYESVRTRELGYIYRDERRVARVNLFDARIPNLIGPGGPVGAGFVNDGFVDARGIELEWTEQLLPWLRVGANWSRFDSKDTRTQPRLPPGQTAVGFGTPEALANLMLIATPNRDWTFGLHWNHVDTRQSQTRDFPGYEAVSVSVERRFGGLPGLALRAGVRNALDDEIRHVLSRPPPGLFSELDYSERLWSVELSYDF